VRCRTARLVCGDNISVSRYDRDADIVPGAILIADTVISDCQSGSKPSADAGRWGMAWVTIQLHVDLAVILAPALAKGKELPSRGRSGAGSSTENSRERLFPSID
jgi:hypothetical protein